MSTKPLTPKQQRFVDEYLIDLNATQAAIRAGYAPGSASVTGSQLLANPKIATEVAEAKKVRSERTEITADWVLQQAVEVYRRVVQEVRPALDRAGHQLHDEGGAPLYKFDASAALRALELVGRHVEVGAFEERVTVTHDLADRIIAAREQVSSGPFIDAD